jgi:AraC-like DNA-binding protein
MNLLVKEAAAEVGFEDSYHFSRVFKKVVGIPPSRFGFGKLQK